MEPLLLMQEVIAQQAGIAAVLDARLTGVLEATIQLRLWLNSQQLVFLAALASSALQPPPIIRFLANLDLSARTCSPRDPARLGITKT